MADARSGRRSVVRIQATGVDKRYQPSRRYMYVLQPTWSDGVEYKVYRSYADIVALSKKLEEAFPIEAGLIRRKERFPSVLSVTKQIFQSKEVLKTAKKRLTEVSTYFEALGKLEEKVRVFPVLCSFFEQWADDINILETARIRRRPKGRNPFLKTSWLNQRKHANMVITAPKPTTTYRAAATYRASGKEEISFNEGELLEVVAKQNVGWWFVRFEGLEGWAPATYLDPVEETSADEDLCLSGELYISLKAHNASHEDELSFPAGRLVEVLNKVLDGWWIGSYLGKAGYVPATYLKPNTTEELCQLPSRLGSIQIPRRNIILRSAVDQGTSPQRDLAPYKRLSLKRYERATRRHQPGGRGAVASNNCSADDEEEYYVNVAELYKQAGTGKNCMGLGGPSMSESNLGAKSSTTRTVYTPSLLIVGESDGDGCPSPASEERPISANKPTPRPRIQLMHETIRNTEHERSGAEDSQPLDVKKDSKPLNGVQLSTPVPRNLVRETPQITPRKVVSRSWTSTT